MSEENFFFAKNTFTVELPSTEIFSFSCSELIQICQEMIKRLSYQRMERVTSKKIQLL